MTRIVRANGIDQAVLEWGPDDGIPLLLIHGNCSSGAYWEPFVRRLIAARDGTGPAHGFAPPSDLRVVAPDLRGYGHSQPAPVDATRGLRDFADDVAALIDVVLGPGARPVVAGHSMGGGVAMQLAIDHPHRIAGLLLESTLSPYGFGGTRDVDGTLTSPDFAGTGAGTANPTFVARLAAKDRTDDDPTSPRQVMRTTYVADPASFGDDEEALLDTVLSTVVGEDNYPGDSSTVATWPGMGPGARGVLNAMTPKYFNVADALVALPTKPPVVWVHGSLDAIVGDATLFDFAQLGKLGLVPGWPGEQECPPQPMIAQTRAVLDRYAGAGGSFTEVLLDGCGHSPHIERPAEFSDALLRLVDGRR